VSPAKPTKPTTKEDLEGCLFWYPPLQKWVTQEEIDVYRAERDREFDEKLADAIRRGEERAKARLEALAKARAARQKKEDDHEGSGSEEADEGGTASADGSEDPPEGD